MLDLDNTKQFTILLITLLTLLSGCSSTSVLVSKQDPTFEYSQKRLVRTAELIRRQNVSENEGALFLQAEGFYRYRFEPPAKSSTSFFLEAASAITDFPGFQSFAGAMSLSDIRVRSADSAVQLWESLLEQYPQTKLKTLALYRLGWAYRNVSAEGLPRSSPDEPFDEILRTEPSGSSYSHLAAEAKGIDWKSKSAASTRSLLPGLGQLYVGETKSGILRLSTAAVAAIAVVVPFYIANRRGQDLSFQQDWPLIGLSLSGLIVLSYDYTSSFQDAMRGVVQWNEAKEKEFEESHPESP